MTRNRLPIAGIMIAALLGAAGCTHLFSQEESLPQKHPVDVQGKHATCTDCHGADDVIKSIGKRYSMFNHSPVYYRQHSFYALAGNNGELCYRCHATSFCADCHTTNGALNPDVKNGSAVEFQFTHRGDYITRHRLDGEADPASCYKCHGRANNAICRQCHRI